MQILLKKLVSFWRNNIHQPITTLVATVGTVGLAICLSIIFIVSHISDNVLDREAFEFDRTILLWIHSFANPILDRVMYYFTRLNDPDTAFIVATVVVSILIWKRFYAEARIFAIACFGGIVLSYGLKAVFGKVRPDLWESAIVDTSFSYPSGHALGSTILYGFSAYLLATHYPRFAGLIYTLAVLLIATIGFSRLYLGVHWPTDIVGGYGIGFLWLTFCVTMLKLNKLKLANVK